MDRQLIDYYPPYLREYLEFQKLTEAEQPEFELLWTASQDLMNDQFIMNATENGISRLEYIYGITPKGNASLDERRNELVTRICERLPFTMKVLQMHLETICGEDEYTVYHDNKSYRLIVKVHLPAKEHLLNVKDLLERVVPQNLQIDLDLRYNQHGDITDYPLTHRDLDQYTHDGIRTEILKKGAELPRNTHEKLMAHRHETLGIYTHNHLKKGEIING